MNSSTLFRRPVKVPDDPLIEVSRLCSAIAHAAYPADEHAMSGVDCVDGLLTRHWIPWAEWADTLPPEYRSPEVQFDLVAPDGKSLDQLRAGDVGSTETLPFVGDSTHRITSWECPLVWSPSDLKLLEQLLAHPSMPKLKYPMSDEEIAEFFDCFFRLEDRPRWYPAILTTAGLFRRKANHQMVVESHGRTLRDEHACGRLIAVDRLNNPVKALSPGSLLPIRDVVAYLERYGIAYSTTDCTDDRKTIATETGFDASRTPFADEALPDGAVPLDKAMLKKMTAGARHSAILARRNYLQKHVSNFNERTAQEAGCSKEWVYKIWKRAGDEKQKAEKVDAVYEKAKRSLG